MSFRQRTNTRYNSRGRGASNHIQWWKRVFALPTCWIKITREMSGTPSPKESSSSGSAASFIKGVEQLVKWDWSRFKATKINSSWPKWIPFTLLSQYWTKFTTKWPTAKNLSSSWGIISSGIVSAKNSFNK